MFYQKLNKRSKCLAQRPLVQSWFRALHLLALPQANTELASFDLPDWGALMLRMIIPRLPDLMSLQLNRNVVLMSMSASSLLGNFRPKKYQFPRLEINDVYFLKVCVFVLINLSIITFFESFIIISSESRYHLDSLELCTTREQQH